MVRHILIAMVTGALVATPAAIILFNANGAQSDRTEAVAECAERCYPYAPVVPDDLPLPGSPDFYCYCDTNVWHPDKVYQESAQTQLDNITSEPPPGWHL